MSIVTAIGASAGRLKARQRISGTSWFVLPCLAFFAVFLLLPVLAVIAIAFTQWTGFSLGQVTWAGTSNFRTLEHDPLFWAALWRTLVYVCVSTITLNIIGLALALLINARVRGHDFLRVALFVPLGISPVIAGVIWQMLLGPLGFANHLLSALGVKGPVQFLGSSLGFVTIIVVAIWLYSGFDVLLYYAALQSVPAERLEAAAMDGAGFLARVWHVVIPYLRPVIGVIVALNLIGGWKIFDIVYVLTAGGPDNSTQVLSTYLYQQAFSFNDMGYAASIALVIMVLAFISAFGLRLLSRES
jgi:raffinose/stachyose/melibiose transport system permease protein